MSTTILVTKLFTPVARPEIISRPRLIQKLNDGLDRKLTLISAPAGFGKTTLITEWLNTIGEGDTSPVFIAWLSLDEGDSDLARFLEYFVAALDRTEGLNSQTDELFNNIRSLQSSSKEFVLNLIINELAKISGQLLFVLDDFHLVDSEAVNDALSYLLDNTPPQLHLIITTREDPLVPLSRLRSRGQLTELRAADLRFTPAEASKFLNQVMGLGLSADEIAALDERTEGWIAGLQLTALSLQGRDDTQTFIRSFAGTNRFVIDYLMDEVLERQPQELHEFLLNTAVLERLSGPLCDAVRFGSGEAKETDKSSQQILEFLDHSNLFIVPLDEDRNWYRYHHLFLDLLRLRLRQTHPDLLPELHQRASLWYEEHGFRSEAIDHALNSGDYERAIELIDKDVEGNYDDVLLLTLQRWIAAIPDDLVTSHPEMLLLKAWTQFNSGQIDNAEQSLMGVAQLLENAEQAEIPERSALFGRTLAIRAFIASLRGDPAECAQLSKQALDMLPAEERAWHSVVTLSLGDAYAVQGQMAAAQKIRAEALQIGQSAGDPFILLMTNLNLAETLWQQGKIQAVVEICERQMQFAASHGLAEAPIIGWLLGLWGIAFAEMNQMEEALELTRKGARLAEIGQDMFYINYSYLCRVRVLFLAGDMTGAETVLHELQQFGQNSMLPLWAISKIAAWQARIWLAQDKMALVSQWEAGGELGLDDDISYTHEPEYVALARAWLSQGKFEDAVALLNRLKEAAEDGGRDLRVVEFLLVMAVAAHAKDNVSQALSLLKKALILGEANGLIQTFVNKGSTLASLLYVALQEDIKPAYAQRILAAFPVIASQPSEANHSQEDGWLEPLTNRELEILQYVAKGLSNPEIGDRLYLSTNTVKTHLRNIFGKLDVSNRIRAVAKGRTLGIILDR